MYESRGKIKLPAFDLFGGISTGFVNLAVEAEIIGVQNHRLE